MNGEFWFAVFILLIGLSVHDVATWRRRRRVSNIERKRQIERMTQSSPTPAMGTYCSLHGEYTKHLGRILPCDIKGNVINGLNCNNKLCWKGAYCWQCRLKPEASAFRMVPRDKLSDIVCEDVQCLYGMKDTGLEYYTTNSSRSIPISEGPFKCNDYLCMSDGKCWKCRLNDETNEIKVINKGYEFDSRVSCCPIPKLLLSVKDSKGGNYKIGGSSSVLLAEEFDDDLELQNSPSITVEFATRNVIVNILLRQKSSYSHFGVWYSADGKTWNAYREYNRKAVFRTTTNHNTKHRILFKPLVVKYLRIMPLTNVQSFEVSAFIYGCDFPSSA